jgi:hypothetical protein
MVPCSVGRVCLLRSVTVPQTAQGAGAFRTVERYRETGYHIGLMRISLSSLRRLALLVAVTVALVATGYAHRMPSGNDVLFEAYVLAGGDLSDLCGDSGGDGMPDHGDCPACHIVGCALPVRTDLPLHDADLVFVAKIVAPRESRALRVVLDPARGLRAPPLA